MSVRVLSLLLPVLLCAAESPPKPFPDMAQVIGGILRGDYYDPGRFSPATMLQQGLRALEADEVGIDAVVSAGSVILRFADDAPGDGHTVAEVAPQTLEDVMAIFDRIAGVLGEGDRYPLDRQRNLMYAMLNGSLHTLDPHTSLLPPQPSDDFNEEIQGEFFGIGAYLSQEDGVVRIDRVMPGLPADSGGVRDGDLIIKVDTEKTAGLSLAQVVRRIKGPKGTAVTLTIERQGIEDDFDLRIVRDRVPYVTMRSHLLGDVGYVRMDEFNRNTAADLLEQIGRLVIASPERKLRGFVLDLRFNSGGLLTQARQIADFFLPHSKEIVSTVSLNERRQTLPSTRKVYLDVPMAVLVGPGSASAAEIVAGALQLNGRAVIIGETSFGKGSVQMLKQLPDDSMLKLTTQEYQLTGEASIQGRGVVPDVHLLAHNTLENGSIDLIPYSARREGDNKFALADHGSYDEHAELELCWLRAWRSFEDMRTHGLSAREFVPDQEASMVLELVAAALDGAGVAEAAATARDDGMLRRFLLDRLVQPVAARSVVESERLRAALAAAPKPLDWGDAGVAAPSGSISIAFDGPPELRAGEVADLVFRIGNQGTADVGCLYALISTDDYSPFWEEEFLVGKVPAGGTATARLSLAVPLRLPSGEERFTVHLHQHPHAKPVAEITVQLAVVGQERPRYGYSWRLASEGTPDGIIALDEEVILELTVRNDGAGAAPGTILYVFKDDDIMTELGEGRFVLEGLEPGASAVCCVPLRVQSRLTAGTRVKTFEGEGITLQVRAEERFEDGADQRYRATFFHSLDLPIGAPFQEGSVAQPNLSIRKQHNDGTTLDLELHLADDNPRYLTVFLDEDKIRLLPVGGLTAAEEGGFLWRDRIALPPGMATVRVAVTDADETSSLVFTRVWGPDEGEKTAAVIPGGAAAPVDTIP